MKAQPFAIGTREEVSYLEGIPILFYFHRGRLRGQSG
jgi:hypothetical protein